MLKVQIQNLDSNFMMYRRWSHNILWYNTPSSNHFDWPLKYLNNLMWLVIDQRCPDPFRQTVARTKWGNGLGSETKLTLGYTPFLLFYRLLCVHYSNLFLRGSKLRGCFNSWKSKNPTFQIFKTSKLQKFKQNG